MAKKKKNRRSVLITSCVMAALIVGSSTFAWFSSTDDVTNRLTSTANYGVSIVESFTPPANWIPGQKVDKQVYDVNTGSIAAFVRNDVSGVLKYTYETLVNTLDKDAGVKLNNTALTDIDGATTMEAGAILAWTNTNEPLGAKNTARDADHVAGTWKPSESGIYIFRRATSTGTLGYTYAGYHYDENTDTYYKIVIGDDNLTSYPMTGDGNNEFDVSSSSLGTGVAVDSNGIVTSGTPSVKYVIETTINATNVSYEYDSTNKTLVFKYTAAIAGAGNETYDASALAARAEVDYQNAQKKSDAADAWAKQATADYEYAKALTEATNALYKQARLTKAANDTSITSDSSYTTAQGDVTAKATAMTTGNEKDAYDAIVSITALDPETIVPAKVKTAAADSDANPRTAQNYADLGTIYNRMEVYSTAIKDNLTELTIAANAADVAGRVSAIKSNLASLKTDLAAYKLKYAALVEQAETETSTTIAAGTDGIKSTIQTKLDTASGLDVGGLETLSGALKTAEDTKNTDAGEKTSADAAWAAAVTAYNTAVETAKTNYDPSNLKEDHGADLIAAYAANPTDSANAPKIAANAEYTTYGDQTTKPDRVLPEKSAFDVTITITDLGAGTTAEAATTKNVSKWESIKTQANADAANKKAIYDDAILKVNTGSTIKINVKLADDYAANWTYDENAADKDTVAHFYYNKILQAGATSDELIASVELDSDVKSSDYKNLTFDLNVGLKSVQVTYGGNDQQTILATATTSELGKTATLQTPTDINTTLTWN